jgi:nicotinate phosphoribosyltransferase
MPRPWLDDTHAALFIDLYELTMAQAYRVHGVTGTATFSLFVRRLPKQRNYLLACGLNDVLHYLETMRFDPTALVYLASLGLFDDEFLSWLEGFRFTGDVRAVPEGTPVFAEEPILEITAPIIEGQLVETFVINQVHLQTLLASKACRVVTAAAGRPVIDFGARRMHGTDAAIKGARAFTIAGVAATSNVFAGMLYDVPVRGTMAHSFIQAFEHEEDAFRAFLRLYPGTILLVDTYDTLRAVQRIAALAREGDEPLPLGGIRIDSGDLGALATECRLLLDAAGLGSVRIYVSSSLDEDSVAALVASGAPIDGFGVGTHMGVSNDAPYLDFVYKLCAYAGEGRLKTSTGKRVLPGRKQVFRAESGGEAVRDVIACLDESLSGRPLLRSVMRNGNRLPESHEPLAAATRRVAEEVARLSPRLRAIDPAEPPYTVEVSAALLAEHERVLARFR